MDIAVIGSGIAGLSAAWLLSEGHRVTLFEAAHYLGGHTNTVDVTLDGETAAVDTGFLVHNERTYPNLIGLFNALGVTTVETDMSFSVRLETPALEWAGSDLSTVFAQPGNLCRRRFWGMLRDILRFNNAAPALLRDTACGHLSLGELLARDGYSTSFRDWYLLPMGGAIWSSPTRAMLDFPAHSFLRFCSNHGLLQLRDRPRWRTIAGGGRRYVERMATSIADIRLATPVRRLERRDDGVRVFTDSGEQRYDAVILACHSDQALALLDDADADEHAILGAIRYQSNHAVLHTDSSLLPRRRRAWSAWNYSAAGGPPEQRPVAVSYLLNKLQPLPFTQPLLVTLNPHQAPAPERVLASFAYAHPVFDRHALAAQRRLPQIQGRRRTWFAGAWTGYGFHEDGLKSGMSAAGALGGAPVWQRLSA